MKRTEPLLIPGVLKAPDGVGAAEDAAFREAPAIRPRPIIDLSRPEQQRTQVMDLSRTLQLHTVRLEVSQNLLAELREAPAAAGVAPVVTPATERAPAAQSGDTVMFEPAAVQAAAFARPPHSAHLPRSAELVNTLYDGGALREHAAQLAGARESETVVAEAISTPVSARARAPGALRRLLFAFRESSLPKQLTIALLPLAVAAVWAMGDGPGPSSDPRSPAPTRAAPSVVASEEDAPSPSAAPTPSAAPSPSAAPGSSNAASAAQPSAPQTAVQPGDARERLALIAAFSGNRTEAALLYDDLALTRNARVFTLAARLTREDRVRKP